MARNKLTDLNDHLFAQLERLGDEDTVGVDLEDEVKRARAIEGIAKNVIANASLVLEAVKLSNDKFPVNSKLPDTFGLNKGNNE